MMLLAGSDLTEPYERVSSDDVIAEVRRLITIADKPSEAVTFECLRQLYDGVDAAGTLDFLRMHRDLLPLLFEGSSVIVRHFGPHARGRLELHRDPRGFEPPELFVIIVLPQSIDNAVDRLDQMDQTWWIDRCREAAGRLNFDIGR